MTSSVTHGFVNNIPDDPTAAAAGETLPSHWNAAHSVSIDHADLTDVTATQHHDNANDPSSGQKAALAGTSGTPGALNKYVTDADSRLTDSRAPTGSAGGDLSGTYPNPAVQDDSHAHTGSTVTTTDAPSGAAISIDTAATAGAGTAIARATHGHQVSTTDAPSGAVVSIDANPSAGSTGAIARATHGHRLNTSSSAAAAVGTASAGTSTTAPSRGDHVHPTGAGTPSTQAFGDAAATGSGPAAAMTDHKHAMPNSTTGPDANVTIDASGAAGSANTAARSGHGHQVATDSTAQVAVTPDGTATAGTSGTIARSQHQHGMATYSSTPAIIGTASAGTSATAPSRGDHVHAVSALPTFVNAGTPAHGTGDVTPGLPTGHTTNDILILLVQSDNQTATAPATYTQLGPVAGIGTAAAALATRLSIFWKRDGGSESDPTVTDTGDHTLAVIIAIRGCVTSGDPFVSVGQTRKTTASTTGTAAAGATHCDNAMIVNCFAHGIDTTAAVFSAWTNADLSNVTEQVDTATTDGNGGGIGVATGTLATAGPFRSTTVTETSTTDVSSTFYMIPVSANARTAIVDQQVFLTPGVGDTWTKPSGAKLVIMTAIGGGASGSAGRNAATASGGGGGGGGHWRQQAYPANTLPATLAVTPGAGGAATANSDGAASNIGNVSQATTGGLILFRAMGGGTAGTAGSGSGGLGGNGAGFAPATAVGTDSFGSNQPGGGTGGTTAAAGANARDFAGGAGAGGGTTQATSAGGLAASGGGGGGGGRANTNVGTGGAGGTNLNPGGQTASAAGTDSPYPTIGGGGGAGGTSTSGLGGTGGFPGGGGGGGGSQSGAQGGGAGGDGVVTIVTFC